MEAGSRDFPKRGGGASRLMRSFSQAAGAPATVDAVPDCGREEAGAVRATAALCSSCGCPGHTHPPTHPPAHPPTCADPREAQAAQAEQRGGMGPGAQTGEGRQRRSDAVVRLFQATFSKSLYLSCLCFAPRGAPSAATWLGACMHTCMHAWVEAWQRASSEPQRIPTQRRLHVRAAAHLSPQPLHQRFLLPPTRAAAAGMCGACTCRCAC